MTVTMMTSNTLDLDPPSATSADVFLHLSSWWAGNDDDDSGGDDDNDGSFYDGDDDDDSFPLTMFIQDVKLMDSSNHEYDSSQCGSRIAIKVIGWSSDDDNDDHLAGLFQAARV